MENRSDYIQKQNQILTVSKKKLTIVPEVKTVMVRFINDSARG